MYVINIIQTKEIRKFYLSYNMKIELKFNLNLNYINMQLQIIISFVKSCLYSLNITLDSQSYILKYTCNFNCTTGNNNGCSSSIPYRDPVTNNCVANCPSRFFKDTAAYKCLACHYSCLTCTDAVSGCLTCSSTDFRTKSGTACQPNNGYYDNGVAIAVKCPTECTLCSSATVCSACVSPTYYLSTSTCMACSTITPQCLNCTMLSTTPTCTGCKAGYAWNSGTQLCQVIPCTDPNCQTCAASPSVCQVCKTGFTKLSNATCKNICGDGILVGNEQCDDGNTVDGDGCNFNCTTGNNNGCSSSIPYRDPVTNNCVANCPSRFFKDTAAYKCLACHYSCLTCTDAVSGCTSCSSTVDFRVLNGITCSPKTGYFQSNAQIATKCPVQCTNCTSPTVCSACTTPTYYLSGTSCLACDTITSLCSKCTITNSLPQCTGCTSGYFYNKTTLVCQVQPCTDLQCLDCPNSISYCISCQPGYYPTAGACVSICGDNYKTSNQLCDDGNTLQKDGCSKQCTIQNDFVCEVQSGNSNSTCYYTGTVTVSKIYIDKIDNENKISIKLGLIPNDLAVWNDINFMDMIDIQIQLLAKASYSVSRDTDGNVVVQLKYNQDIHNKDIKIVVDPTKTRVATLVRAAVSSASFAVVPDDNSGAYYYEQGTYAIAGVIQVLALALSTAAFVVFLSSLAVGKVIGVEMIAVLQVCYLSLMTLDTVNPCFAALGSLWISCGFNIGMKKAYIQDTYAPKQSIGVFLTSKFLQNFNTGLILILLPLTVGLVIFILSKTALNNKSEKLLKITQKAVGQYTFTGFMFNAYLLASSFALQVMYGLKSDMGLTGIFSIIQCCLLLPLFIIYSILLIKKPFMFGQFKQQFKSTPKHSQKFYNIMIIQRLIVGAGLVFLLNIKLQVILPLVICIALAVVVIVFKIYKNNYNNYRFIANMVITVIVLIIFIVYGMSTQQHQNKKNIYLYMPLVICFLLITCVVYNFAFILYSMYRMYKDYKAKELEDNDIAQFNKTIKQDYIDKRQQRNRKASYLYTEIQPNRIDKNKIIEESQIERLEEIKKKLKLNAMESPNNLTSISQRENLLDITYVNEHPGQTEKYRGI